MKTYHGSCHCGEIRFEVKAKLEKVVECNCSVCTKKGALHHRVDSENFKLLSGEEALILYQFNTKTARHYFCKHCGIHPFSRSRVDPEMYSVNVRCLDDFDLEKGDFKKVFFDGKNWEEAVKGLG